METVSCKRRGCCAQIFFALTANRAIMPIDARPFAREEIARTGRWSVRPAVSSDHCHGLADWVAHRDDIDTAKTVYVAHWASCPAFVRDSDIKRYSKNQPALAARIREYMPRELP